MGLPGGAIRRCPTRHDVSRSFSEATSDDLDTHQDPKVASDGAELRPRQSNERSLDVLAAQLGSIGRLERRRCSPLDLAVHGGMC
jgi:hypothetical protein